jgi:glycosyltransferase involved in cell wall biosynthesis
MWTVRLCDERLRCRRDVMKRVSAQVLFVGSSADQYAADEMLWRIACHFRNLGHSVHVVLPADGPLCRLLDQLSISYQIEPVPVIRKDILSPFAFLRFLAATIGAIPRMRRVLKCRKPSVVWVNTVTVPLWLVLGRLLGCRAVCHSHEIVDRPRLLRFAIYLPLMLAHSVVAVSEAVRQDVKSTYSSVGRRTVVVLNAAFEFASGVALQKGRERDIVVIGRLSPRKGQHVALEALRYLSPSLGSVRLHVCGTPFPGYDWYEDELRAAARSLPHSVEFHGYCNKAEAFSLGGIVAVPSTVPDPCPLVVFEALAAGRAVVASNTGGIPEILGRRGRLVPPGDPLALAAHFEALVLLPSEDFEGERSRSRKRAAALSPDRFFREITHVLSSQL